MTTGFLDTAGFLSGKTSQINPGDGQYKGLWDPVANDPDISLVGDYSAGDYFFVSQDGTYNGVDYKQNDKIIF